MCRHDIGSVKYNLERFFQMTGWVGFGFGFFVVVLGFLFFFFPPERNMVQYYAKVQVLNVLWYSLLFTLL